MEIFKPRNSSLGLRKKSMIEYPSITNSSKAPRQPCIAFEKLDGSNFRAKWTKKHGFNLFGTRTQLIDESSKFWNNMIQVFNANQREPLEKLFNKKYPNEREIIVFGEFFGEKSFAGRHEETDSHKIVVFDILVGHKNRKFILPQEFIKLLDGVVEIPRPVYDGNLNEQFIQDVRDNKFDLNEGVICKGRSYVGNAVGGVWMCKIKTRAYFDRLQTELGTEWVKYWE